MTLNNRDFLGHPKGLFLLFSSELWERFSFYVLRAVLVLYLTDATANGGLGWTKSDALKLYGLYTGLVYLTPIIGGWLADSFFGRRKSVVIGAFLMASGQFALAMPDDFFPFGKSVVLYAGLGLLICGNGLFKPNISTMVGDLYPAADDRRDSAFTIFYMGINIGAFCSGIAAGFTTAAYSFKAAFVLAGAGMLIALFLQAFLGNRYLGDIGKAPAKFEKRSAATSVKLTKKEINRLTVIFILGIFTVVFWAGFEQAGGVMTLFAAENTNRVIAERVVPPTFFQSLNPLFIITFAPVLAWLWVRPGGRDPSFVAKFVWALIFSGAGFLLMTGAVKQSETANLASPLWLVGTYFLHTIGELCLSPTGLSMVTRLSPARFSSMMMGIWFGFSAVANFMAGWIGSYVEDFGAGALFSGFAAVSFIAAGVLFFLREKLLKICETA